MSTNRNIYHVLAPLFYTTKIVGLAPFRIQHPNGYESSKFNIIYSFSLAICLSINFYIALNIRSDPEDGLILILTDVLHMVFSTLSVIITIIFGCVYKNKILDVLKAISKLDEELLTSLDLNVKGFYYKSRKWVIFGSAATSGSIYFLIILDYFAFVDKFNMVSILNLIAYTAPFITAFGELQFCTIVLLLKQRFGWLNKKLVEISRKDDHNLKQEQDLKQNVGPIIFKKVISEPAQNLEKIRIAHQRLCKICVQLNTAYSVQLLLIFVETILTILVPLFYFSKFAILGKFKTLPTLIIAYFIARTLLCGAQILALTFACSTTVEEAKKTGIFIHKIVFRLKNVVHKRKYNSLQLQVVYFLLQLLQQDLKFTACKMFVIDETLLVTIVGAIATSYLVVVTFELNYKEDI